jgi:hypothetical protein
MAVAGANLRADAVRPNAMSEYLTASSRQTAGSRSKKCQTVGDDNPPGE